MWVTANPTLTKSETLPLGLTENTKLHLFLVNFGRNSFHFLNSRIILNNLGMTDSERLRCDWRFNTRNTPLIFIIGPCGAAGSSCIILISCLVHVPAEVALINNGPATRYTAQSTGGETQRSINRPITEIGIPQRQLESHLLSIRALADSPRSISEKPQQLSAPPSLAIVETDETKHTARC